jgi:hypothetical protein
MGGPGNRMVVRRLAACFGVLALLATNACAAIAGIGDLPFPSDAGADDHTVVTPPVDGSDDKGEVQDASVPPDATAMADGSTADSSDGTTTSDDASDGSEDAPPPPPPTDGGPLLIQHNGSSSPFASGGTTLELDVPFNTPVRAHDTLIVAADFGSGETPTVTDSLGNVFNKAIGPSGSGGVQAAIWYALDAKGGSDTVHFTIPNASSGQIEGYVQEFAGIVATNALDSVSAGSGPQADPEPMDSGPVTTSAQGDLLFAFGVSGSVQPEGNFHECDTTNQNLTEYEVVGAPGTYDATALGGGDTWILLAAAFKTH